MSATNENEKEKEDKVASGPIVVHAHVRDIIVVFAAV